MSRENVLVDADWVEDHLDDPKRRARRGRRGHLGLRQGPHPRRRQARLEDRPAGPGPPRLRQQGSSSRRCSPARGIGNDDTVVLYGGNNNWFAAYAYWYFKLYGHAGRQAARRRPQEVGAGLPRAGHRRAAAPASGRRTPRRSRTPRSARSATRSSPRSAPRTSSTCAAPTSTPAGCSPRRTCRRSRRSGPVTSRPRSTCRGRKAANDDGTFKSDDELHSALRRGRPRLGKDTIAYCRIGERSAHTWFVLHELLGQPNVKNYDGSWTEYGSLVGVPVALGDEAGDGLMCGADCEAPGLSAGRRRTWRRNP